MLYYSQGTALVARDEMMSRSTVGTNFLRSLQSGQRPKSVPFSTGVMSPEAPFAAPAAGGAGAVIPFKEIGVGKPLTVQIREVYTGMYPAPSWFGQQKGMLLTSAIKSITTFDAKARAVNFLKDAVGAHQHMARPDATSQGTPFIFYSPALLDNSLTLDLGMVFDNFPKDLVTSMGNAIQSAAGIPIFMAQGALLLAAGAAVKLAAQAAEMIFDGKPAFLVSGEAIDIFWPGSPVALPGFRLITQDNVDSVDPDFRQNYQVNEQGSLVDKDGKRYDGEIPYIIISLDGTSNDQLKNFAPTAAAANLLSRFYGQNADQSQPIDVVLQAIKLYNDYTYRQKADQIDAQLKNTTDPDAQKALQTERDALLKNISSDLLKPNS